MDCFITTVISLRAPINPRRDNDGVFQYLCHLSVGNNQPRRDNDGVFHYHCHLSAAIKQSQTR